MRKFILKDTGTRSEFVFPVTPSGFKLSHGMRVETVNIHSIGDINIAGGGTLAQIQIECSFPSQLYPFVCVSNLRDPYWYVKRFRKWIDEKTILRFIVSGTKINIPVLVQEIHYGEKDGTGDVIATITFREYRTVKAPKTEILQSETERSVEGQVQQETTYVTKYGDTLPAISRKFFGNASLVTAITAINSIVNPSMLLPRIKLTIPVIKRGLK